MKFLKILFWKIAIYSIKKGYGANCKTSDLEDFPEMYSNSQAVFNERRCASCRAKETIKWIENNISLIEEFE